MGSHQTTTPDLNLQTTPTQLSRRFDHPLWNVGFRPLFTLAMLAGALLPLLWAALFAGWWQLPSPTLSPVQWHAHEMFFGFGWAILGGFLLTASKNWLRIRGLHGRLLALVTLAWLVERIAILYVGSLPFLLEIALINCFGLAVAGYVVGCLIKYRKQDTFSDNYFFVLVLPLLVAAKYLILDPNHFAAGAAIALGVFRIAFAVMFERTLTQFMKTRFGATLPRIKALDNSIKGLLFLAIFESFAPSWFGAFACGAGAVLLSIRFVMWKPQVAFRVFEIGVMYVGYLALVAHLIFSALNHAGTQLGVGTLTPHIFVFGCMGLVIPAMLIRICQGHTGRSIVFARTDRMAIWTMGMAGVLRLGFTQLWPQHYLIWIAAAAFGWSLCFALLALRMIPFLFQPRVDGRIH